MIVSIGHATATRQLSSYLDLTYGSHGITGVVDVVLLVRSWKYLRAMSKSLLSDKSENLI